MNLGDVREYIGRKVLACDAYWGSYIGKLVRVFDTPMSIRAEVKVIGNVEPPSQRAIIFTENYVTRKPYSTGQAVNFDLPNVQGYDGFMGGMILEDILKDIVSKALEAKLGYSVVISKSEWEAAKTETLNDVYVNKFCFFRNVSSDYFINTMVEILAISKRIAA